MSKDSVTQIPWITIRYRPIRLDPDDAVWKVLAVALLMWGSFAIGFLTGVQ